MAAQYLAGRSSPKVKIAAFGPQTLPKGDALYFYSPLSCMVRLAHSGVGGKPIRAIAARQNADLPMARYRRNTCRSLSKPFWPLAYLPRLAPVPARPKKTISSSSIPNRFRWNLSTQASTNKPCAGRAAAPASRPQSRCSFLRAAPGKGIAC